MAEREGMHVAKGWTLDHARVRLELYRFLAAVFASWDLWGSQGWHGVGCAVDDLREQFERGEIENGLVAVASMTRVLLDQTSPRPEQARAACGTLTQGTQPPVHTRDLTLREACNKILHATSREYYTGGDPVMRLQGSQFESPWEATVDLLAFAARVAELTSARQP